MPEPGDMHDPNTSPPRSFVVSDSCHHTLSFRISKSEKGRGKKSWQASLAMSGTLEGDWSIQPSKETNMSRTKSPSKIVRFEGEKSTGVLRVVSIKIQKCHLSCHEY